jgi:hypothetical protein
VQEFKDYLVDQLLLASGDALVGKFTSNIDRVAYALMAGGSHCLVPYISLDSAWCHPRLRDGLGYSVDSKRMPRGQGQGQSQGQGNTSGVFPC